MTGKEICTGLVLTAFLLNGCAGAKDSSQAFRIVLTNMSAYEKQWFSEQQRKESADTVEILEENETTAVDMLRKGQADCGYGIVSGENAIQYGILKSDVVKRREMLLVSDRRVIHSGELEGLVVGYPDSLDEEFAGYLLAAADMELHAYLSEEQLENDLKSGLLDLIAAEEDVAFRILEAGPDSWQISQTSDMPVLEYRFFACTQEALDQAAAFRKEN